MYMCKNRVVFSQSVVKCMCSCESSLSRCRSYMIIYVHLLMDVLCSGCVDISASGVVEVMV